MTPNFVFKHLMLCGLLLQNSNEFHQITIESLALLNIAKSDVPDV